MKFFDPKYRIFSWALAEQQLRRESITTSSMELLGHVIVKNVDVEKSVKALLEDDA